MSTPENEPVRMPDGVRHYLEHGASPARQAEEETRAHAPGNDEGRSYESARAYLSRPVEPRRPREGRGLVRMIGDAIEARERDERGREGRTR